MLGTTQRFGWLKTPPVIKCLKLGTVLIYILKLFQILWVSQYILIKQIYYNETLVSTYESINPRVQSKKVCPWGSLAPGFPTSTRYQLW